MVVRYNGGHVAHIVTRLNMRPSRENGCSPLSTTKPANHVEAFDAEGKSDDAYPRRFESRKTKGARANHQVCPIRDAPPIRAVSPPC